MPDEGQGPDVDIFEQMSAKAVAAISTPLMSRPPSLEKTV